MTKLKVAGFEGVLANDSDIYTLTHIKKGNQQLQVLVKKLQIMPEVKLKDHQILDLVPPPEICNTRYLCYDFKKTLIAMLSPWMSCICLILKLES